MLPSFRIYDEFKTNNKACVGGIEVSRIPLSEVDLLSPIIKPDKVFKIKSANNDLYNCAKYKATKKCSFE